MDGASHDELLAMETFPLLAGPHVLRLTERDTPPVEVHVVVRAADAVVVDRISDSPTYRSRLSMRTLPLEVSLASASPPPSDRPASASAAQGAAIARAASNAGRPLPTRAATRFRGVSRSPAAGAVCPRCLWGHGESSRKNEGFCPSRGPRRSGPRGPRHVARANIGQAREGPSHRFRRGSRMRNASHNASARRTGRTPRLGFRGGTSRGGTIPSSRCPIMRLAHAIHR